MRTIFNVLVAWPINHYSDMNHYLTDPIAFRMFGEV